jgi:tetratricopeptide (TPR) repeat protein
LCYLNLKKYDLVIKDCENAINLNPKSIKGYYYQGRAYYDIDQKKEAETNFSKAYELSKGIQKC